MFSYLLIAGSIGRRGLLLVLLLLGFIQHGHSQQAKHTELQLAGILLKPNGMPLAGARVQLGYHVNSDPVAITNAAGRFCFTLASDTIAQDSLVLYAFHLPKIGCYYHYVSVLVPVASHADYCLRLQQDTHGGFRWQRRRRIRSVHI